MMTTVIQRSTLEYLRRRPSTPQQLQEHFQLSASAVKCRLKAVRPHLQATWIGRRKVFSA